MKELSQEAQQALGSFNSVHARPTQMEEAGRQRFAQALAEEQLGGVVTPEFRRKRALKVNVRLFGRAIATGVLAFSAIWFVDRGLPEMNSRNMLEEAQELMAEQEYRQAYYVLAEHSRSFPTREKAEARVGLVVNSLCGMGLTGRARLELERYVDRVPETEHAKRLVNPCAGITPGEAPPDDL